MLTTHDDYPWAGRLMASPICFHADDATEAALQAWADHEQRSRSAQLRVILRDAIPPEFWPKPEAEVQ